jgi:hypothetical protein
MAIAQGTIVAIFVFFLFIYFSLYCRKEAVFKVIACVGFLIGFGLILPSATNNTEYGIAVAGMLFSIGLAFINFITPDSKAKKGRIF